MSYIHVSKGSRYMHIDWKFLKQTLMFRSVTCISFRNKTDSHSCEKTQSSKAGIRKEVSSWIRNTGKIVSAGVSSFNLSTCMLLTYIFISITCEKENYIDRKYYYNSSLKK